MAALNRDTLVTVVAAAVTIFVLLYIWGSRKIHPNEPTVLAPKVPFVGHLLGMAFQGGQYVKSLGLSYKDVTIFTLPVPRSRIYVVTDPSLAVAVQRASKQLSFTPLVPGLTERILGLDKRTVEIVSRNLDPEKGEERGFLADMHDLLYTSLGPGEMLNEMSVAISQKLLDEMRHYISNLEAQSATLREVDLLVWIRHFVAMGTAGYLYGDKNPFEVDPELEKCFWDFDHGLGGLLMGVMPSLTAAKAYRGRERLAKALVQYLEAGHHKTASAIVQKRIQITKQYNISTAMTARSELSFLFAGIVNTATTLFWVILHVFSRPELLETVRAEIDLALAATQENHGEGHISITAVKEHCPNLEAVYRECLRIGSETFSTRLVKADTVIANKWFLRKDSVIQIAGGVFHSDKDIWGDDVDMFNHERFLKRGTSRETKMHPAAYRPFGGGRTLCPGYRFATNEILMLATALIHEFDFHGLVPVAKDDKIMPVHILEPKTAVRATVNVRSLEERGSTLLTTCVF